MGSLESHSVHPREPEDPRTDQRNRRYGLVLFMVYGLVYAGFVLLNAFRPQWAEHTPWRGVNVAVLYGLLLIGGAFALALVYGWLCRFPVGGPNREDRGA